MADKLDQIREGIKTALSTIEGVQVSAQFLSNPTPPAIHVFPPSGQYHRAMGNGHTDWNLTVQAFAAMTSDIGAQKLLDKFIADAGPYSVRQAIEADGTLGGVADDTIVQGFENYGVRVRPDGTLVLAVDFNVLVLAGDS
jgi:hypothetical protein